MSVTAPLLAAYMGVPGKGDRPPLPEDVFTMCPPSPWLRISGTKALMPCTTPITFTPIAQIQSLRSCSHIQPCEPEPTPALLQTTCTLPKRSKAASRKAATSSHLRTSQSTPSTSDATSSSATRASFKAASSTSASITDMPSAKNRSAMA